MSSKAEIKKIVLDLGGVEVSITPEQAKTLHGLLDTMYGSKTVFVPDYRPPVVIRDRRWHWDRDTPMWSSTGSPEITYSANTQTVCMAVD